MLFKDINESSALEKLYGIESKVIKYSYKKFLKLIQITRTLIRIKWRN